MSNPDQIKTFLSMFAVNLPTFLVCILAGIVIIARWKQAAGAAPWALCGFGLALALCILVPLVQTFVHTWVMQSGDVPRRASVYTVLSIFWSVLKAISYALLLAALFIGRPPREQP